MDMFDDIESTNARAWDEETRGRHSPRATAEIVSRPEQHSNGTSLLSPRVPGTITDVPQTKPGRQTVSSGTDQKVGRRDLTPLEHHSYKQPGRPPRDQIGRKVEWSKQNAVNTKRKQDYLHREAQKAAKGSEFLGIPTEPNFSAEGYYFWSDSSIDPKSLLGENLEVFDNIRTNCEVYIDFMEGLNCIRLRSKTRRNIESGFAGIKTKIQHVRADAASHAPIYIVDPPAVGNMRSNLTPVLRNAPLVGKQPTIIRIVLTGSTLDTEQRAIWEVERQAIIKNNKDRFSRHMMTALTELGPLNKTKRMRSNLGQIHLLRYRKSMKEGFSFPKFSSMMEEMSTQGKFEKIIHEASVIGRILDGFSTATSLFEPTGSLISHLADVGPKHRLVVIAHRPSNQFVRIETDIDMAQNLCREEYQKAPAWQIGATKYYHYGHNVHKTRFAVGILSVECKFDSCLELTTEDVMSQPPKVFQRLAEGSIFGTSSFATENSRLSYPAVKLLVPEGVVVDKVLIRSAFQYKLLNTSYIAEVAIYNGWNSNDTRQVPVTSCGVSLYHKDWDLLMTPDEGTEGTRALDLGSLFPDASGAEEGLSNFLAHNQTLQRFISHVTIDASVHMGSGLPTS